MLEIEDLAVSYGPVAAVEGVSLTVAAGRFVSLLGANGAGKTTVLNAVIGVLEPRRGLVRFEGRVISGRPCHEIVDAGISLVPEGRQLFAGMSVLENLELSFSHRMIGRLDRVGFRRRLDEVCTYFPRIGERLQQNAGTMSGGEQQMIAIARSLMSGPKLLVLDEPSLGLSPIMVDFVFSTLVRLRASGLSILLVEQNATMALDVSDHAYVLEKGRLTVSGPSRELRQDGRVQQAYLGM